MIFDSIKNMGQYASINDGFEKAGDFLRREDLSTLAVGRYEIEGSNVYAMVQEYETKALEEAKLEAHRKYIDIQYIIEGTENMGYANIDGLGVLTEYDAEKDFMLLEGSSRLIPFGKDEFFILFPEDAHMPGVSCEAKAPVKKVVVKVKI